VNSIKARLPVALAWLRDAAPDVVLLQEIKCLDENFPRLEIEDLGYNVAVAGQKTYNGVAVLSKRPMEVEQTSLPGDDEDDHARYLEVLIGNVRVASVYLPNGNPAFDEDGRDSAKYTYKLAWMERLFDHVNALLATEDAFVLGGDYNVIPEEADVYDPPAWTDDALFRPETRAAWRKILHLGVTDAFRALHADAGRYSYWGYQRGAWNKDHGLRIDHLVLSPQAVDRLQACGIDKGPRAAEKPSDHTPVWCEIAD
jgi:exodeoxyribonuclease-3